MSDPRVVTIVDPAAEDEAERRILAPRLGSLEGRTVGLIDNAKRMADVFLDELEDLLRTRYSVAAFHRYRKASASVASPPETLARLVEACDGVVHAVAD